MAVQQTPFYQTGYRGLNPNMTIDSTKDYFSVNDPTDQFGTGRIDANKAFVQVNPAGFGGNQVSNAYVYRDGKLNQLDMSGMDQYSQYQKAMQDMQKYKSGTMSLNQGQVLDMMKQVNPQEYERFLKGSNNVVPDTYKNQMVQNIIDPNVEKYYQQQYQNSYNSLLDALGALTGGGQAQQVQSNLLSNLRSYAQGPAGVDLTGQTLRPDQVAAFLQSQSGAPTIDQNNQFVQRSAGVLPEQRFAGGQFVGQMSPEEQAAKAQADTYNQQLAAQQAALEQTMGIPPTTITPKMSQEEALSQLLNEAALIQQGYNLVGSGPDGTPLTRPEPAFYEYNPSLPTGPNGEPRYMMGENGNIEYDPYAKAIGAVGGVPKTIDEFYGIPGYEAGMGTNQGAAPTPSGAGTSTTSGGVTSTSTSVPGSTTNQDDLMAQLMEIATNEAKLKQANRVGMANLSDQPIAQSFISGQQASLERRLANNLAAVGMYAEPLKLQLAQEQAKAAAALDASKFEEEKRKNLEEEAYRKAVLSKPITLSDGSILIDPMTGQPILENTKNFAPKSSSGRGSLASFLVSLAEAD